MKGSFDGDGHISAKGSGNLVVNHSLKNLCKLQIYILKENMTCIKFFGMIINRIKGQELEDKKPLG